MHNLHFVLNAPASQRVHDALACLSKFSEYVCLEARPNRLTLSALNSSKSAYGAVALSGGRFFEEYAFSAEGEDEGGEGGEGDEGEGGRFTCRLYSKALLAVFRQRPTDSKSPRTSITKCTVTLSAGLTRPTCRLLFTLLCTHGVLKRYKLTYEPITLLTPVIPLSSPNTFTLSSHHLVALISHFAPTAEALDIASDAAAPDRASFTSFTTGVATARGEILKMPLNTNIALDTADFDAWDVTPGVRVAVGLKDVRAVANHALTMEAALEVRYGEPGMPLKVRYEADGVRCEFTMMTMAERAGGVGAVVKARFQERASPPPRPTPAAAEPVPSRSEVPLFRFATQSESPTPPSLPSQPQTQPQPPIPRPRKRPASPPLAPSSSGESQGTQIPPSRPIPPGLFRSFDSDSDDDADAGWDEPMLRWEAHAEEAGPGRSIGVVKDQGGAGEIGGGEEQEEEDSEGEWGTQWGRDGTGGVGPTQGVSQARGLFEF